MEGTNTDLTTKIKESITQWSSICPKEEFTCADIHLLRNINTMINEYNMQNKSEPILNRMKNSLSTLFTYGKIGSGKIELVKLSYDPKKLSEIVYNLEKGYKHN